MKKKKITLYLALIILLMTIIGIAFKPLLKSLNFGLDLQGGFEVLYQVKGIDNEKITTEMTTNTYKTISRRIDVTKYDFI